MSNPFDQNIHQNPWATHSDGPLYGNAYEDNANTITMPQPTTAATATTSPTLPPRRPANSIPQKMPSPSDYHSTTNPVSPLPPVTTTSNAWQQQQESNKTLAEDDIAEHGRNAWASSSPQPPAVNAYQYSGTPYGNTPTMAHTNAYSNQPTATTDNVSHNDDMSSKLETTNDSSKKKKKKKENGGAFDDNDLDKDSRLPSKIRVLLRFLLLITAVGHLGFAAGASPYSGEPVPFNSSACFYFLFAVAILSIIYSCYHIVFYFVRRFGNAARMKRLILVFSDLLMALLWGIGIIVEIAKYNCPPGYYNGWCHFYNTSIFFGFVSFVLYVVLLGWDVFAGCCNSRKD